MTNQQQNVEVLRAMDRRAALQLRLQETVEGLSVVAISYYAVSLAEHVFGPLAHAAGLSRGGAARGADGAGGGDRLAAGAADPEPGRAGRGVKAGRVAVWLTAVRPSILMILPAGIRRKAVSSKGVNRGCAWEDRSVPAIAEREPPLQANEGKAGARQGARYDQPPAMSSAIPTMTLAWRTEAMSMRRPL